MTKFATSILVLAAMALATPFILKGITENYRASFTKDESVSRPARQEIPQIPDLLKASPVTEMKSLTRLITLEQKNTVVLRGPVTGESVGEMMRQLSKISRNVPASSTIYLVLDTPGGSVMDGADFIDFLDSLPQKVTTVTLFAASMGFQIVENNRGERLITRNGMLMSHRAALSGLAGQFDGELESRYRMMKRQIDMLENNDATRMGITLDQYKAKVKDELWIHGFDSVTQKVADAEVLVKCGESYDGATIDMTFMTIFGPVDVTFDACPLVKTPIAIKLDRIQNNAKAYVLGLVTDALLNKEKFLKDWILNDKFHTMFP